jgi:hypothetical protein
MCGYGVQDPAVSPVTTEHALNEMVSKYIFFQGIVKDPGARMKQASLLQMDAKDKVWSTGCIEAIKSFINLNLYIVAGTALGVALMQVCSQTSPLPNRP